jgi:hypothetical protein
MSKNIKNQETAEFNFSDEKEISELKLSNQALGAVMMALQKSLLEQSDIVPVLKGFDFVVASRSEAPDELMVLNPPVFKVNKDTDED